MLTLQAGHPFDTIKVRVQTDHARKYSGPWNCLVTTVRGEGLRALYKGVSPPLLATGAINSLLFGMQVFGGLSVAHWCRVGS
jgi:solute carrier family 25 carnitine/acylcarnitine transporter 20/29